MKSLIEQIEHQIEQMDTLRKLSASPRVELAVLIADRYPIETNHTYRGFDFLVFDRNDDLKWSYYIPYLQLLNIGKDAEDVLQDAKMQIDFFLEASPSAELRELKKHVANNEVLYKAVRDAAEAASEAENRIQRDVWEKIKSRYNYTTT